MRGLAEAYSANSEMREVSHNPGCMICGSDNPNRLGLRMAVAGEQLHGTVTFGAAQEGWPGLAHGGALAAVLDDALGVLSVELGRTAVTANLSVDYRARAPLGRELAVLAWCEEHSERKVVMRGTVHDGETLVAEATAVMVRIEQEWSAADHEG